MEKNKQQTAVEWLFAHLLPHLDWSKIEDRNRFRQLKKEALEMEKEQKEFCWNIAYLSGGFVGKGLPNHEFPTFEQYYNEVYGKE